MTSILRAAAQNLRAYYAAYARLHERRELLNRPWEEEFLHYALDGKLHGHLLPPPNSRGHSVTSDGWCPGWARQSSRTRP